MAYKLHYSSGFTLIELAISMLIIGFLISGSVTGFIAFQETRQIHTTQKDLAEIKLAVLGFAINFGRLPCPDQPDSRDGIEDIVDGHCIADFGWLPYASLGLGIRRDPWNRPYLYRADHDWTDKGRADMASNRDGLICNPPFAEVSIGLCDEGSINIHDIGGYSQTACRTAIGCNKLARRVPVVVLSAGKNGFDSKAISIHETDNLFDNAQYDPKNLIKDTKEKVFVKRQYSGVRNTGFDDQIMWISSHEIKAVLLKAGRLP